MSITFTKKTTLVQANGIIRLGEPGSIVSWIHSYSEQMVEAGKTDGIWERLDENTTTVRLWADEDSALGFVKVIEDAALATGHTDISVTVSDI